MKKVLFTLLVSLIFLWTNKANGNGNLPADWPKITITVEIGKPFTCDVDWNICKINVGVGFLAATAELLEGVDGKGVGHGSGGGGGGSWRINIPRENFAKYYPGFLTKLDGQNSVTFESSYLVPDDVKKALGSVRDLVIQGHVVYPVKYENGVFTIIFPL